MFFALAAATAIGYVEPKLRFLDAVIPGFYAHASNLLLSLLLMLVVGLLRLLYGASLRELAVLAAVVAAANLLYEGYLTLYNTMHLVCTGRRVTCWSGVPRPVPRRQARPASSGNALCVPRRRRANTSCTSARRGRRTSGSRRPDRRRGH